MEGVESIDPCPDTKSGGFLCARQWIIGLHKMLGIFLNEAVFYVTSYKNYLGDLPKQFSKKKKFNDFHLKLVKSSGHVYVFTSTKENEPKVQTPNKN
jgi:hypothetical protein